MRPRLAVLIVFALWTVFAQEPSRPRAPLAIEDVVKLSKEGISDEVIIAALKGNAKAFNLNAEEILELKKLGVSDAVIKYMEDPTLPYSPPPPASPAISAAPPTAAPPAAAPARPPSDPLALKVPPELGIYYLTDKQDFLSLNQKTVVESKQPGKIPLFKGHIVGSVVGAAAATRLANRSATFYARLGEKASIDDLVLLLLDKSGSRRDLDFGSKPGKPVFRVNSVKPFESNPVSPGLFRVVVPPGGAGEYLFYILGSADDKKGLLGRGYDFGVD